MKTILSLILITFFGSSVSEHQRWGQNGHRTTALIAEYFLTDTAAGEVKRVLQFDTMAEVSNWMDNIKSDDAYDYMSPWHYVTIPKGETYETAEKAEEGDMIWAIENAVEKLKSGKLSAEEEAVQLKILIHLVGDLHQPLHVGDRDDTGGNAVRLEWFYENSNLHRVWDSDMIDQKQLSFTELASFLNPPSEEQVKKWQSTSVRDWAHESQTYLEQVYDIPANKRLSYEYSYKNWDTVKEQLMKGGVRLAGLINDIYK